MTTAGAGEHADARLSETRGRELNLAGASERRGPEVMKRRRREAEEAKKAHTHAAFQAKTAYLRLYRHNRIDSNE